MGPDKSLNTHREVSSDRPVTILGVRRMADQSLGIDRWPLSVIVDAPQPTTIVVTGRRSGGQGATAPIATTESGAISADGGSFWTVVANVQSTDGPAGIHIDASNCDWSLHFLDHVIVMANSCNATSKSIFGCAERAGYLELWAARPKESKVGELGESAFIEIMFRTVGDDDPPLTLGDGQFRLASLDRSSGVCRYRSASFINGSLPDTEHGRVRLAKSASIKQLAFLYGSTEQAKRSFVEFHGSLEDEQCFGGLGGTELTEPARWLTDAGQIVLPSAGFLSHDTIVRLNGPASIRRRFVRELVVSLNGLPLRKTRHRVWTRRGRWSWEGRLALEAPLYATQIHIGVSSPNREELDPATDRRKASVLVAGVSIDNL